MTKGRALELERQIEAARRELGERVAAAETRAAAAEARANDLYALMLQVLTRRPQAAPVPERKAV